MRVDDSLRRARHALLGLLWAPQCVLCGRTGRAPQRDLCDGCEQDLPVNERCCSVCAAPLHVASEEAICSACARHMPRFDVCFAPFHYAYPLDHLIRALKYGGAVTHGRVLGELFAARLSAAGRDELPDILLPVPLGQARFAARGYNQATELAAHIARELRIPLHTDALIRTRETLEQAGLDRKSRRHNLRGAFALRRPLGAVHAAIVDDVVTTGSTANEIARVLKRAGVECVEVWAIARAARQPLQPSNT